MASGWNSNGRIALAGCRPDSFESLCALDGRLSPSNFAHVSEVGENEIDAFAGLLVMGDTVAVEVDADRDAVRQTHDFLATRRPVLASGDGAVVLNAALGGTTPEIASKRSNQYHASDRTTLFLTVGSKTAMTIGGSGWVTVRHADLATIPLNHISTSVMASAITDGSEVAAYEMPGHHWTIGAAWDIRDVDLLPSGFGNLFEAFVDRTVG